MTRARKRTLRKRRPKGGVKVTVAVRVSPVTVRHLESAVDRHPEYDTVSDFIREAIHQRLLDLDLEAE